LKEKHKPVANGLEGMELLLQNGGAQNDRTWNIEGQETEQEVLCACV